VSDASAVLFVVLVVYQSATQESARAITGVFQWLPMLLFPLVICQLFSAAGAVDIGAFFWSLRRRAAERPDEPRASVDLAYPYCALCVLSASAANVRTPVFYVGLCLLAAWALWPIRSRRYAPVWWVGGLLAVVTAGYWGHIGLVEVQRVLERRAAAWLLDLIQRDTDPYRATTALGEIGVVKLSDRIVLRVDADPEARPPILLREASYNVFATPSWYAVDAGFARVQPEADGETWTLRAGVAPERRLTIAAYLRRGRGVLALPNGAARLDRLAVVHLSKNRLGAVRVEEGLGLVTFAAHASPGAAPDEAPTSADLVLPPGEAAAITRAAAELDLAGRSPGEALAAIRAYFLGRFRYTRFLEGTPVGTTPLAEFLHRTRAGHCEYFASATVLLLRAAGIPARYAIGYSVSDWSRLEGRFLVRSRDAHSWAQAWVDGAWRDVDTTPPEWVAVERDAGSFWEPATDVWSWLTFLFSRWRWSERQDRLGGYLGWLLVPLIAILVVRLYRRRRVSRVPAATAGRTDAAPTAGADSEFYLVQRRLEALAHARHPSQPLSAWLAAVGTAPPPGVSVGGLDALLELHYRHRFDPAGLPTAEREALRAGAAAWLAAHETAGAGAPR
jgi:transglutaminase-like putative cysteine protease